ncbi:hypothetical protein PMAYCL1PPCAC_16505, partial [Pristionchus mayeri]
IQFAEMPSYSEVPLVKALPDRWPSLVVVGARCFDHELWIAYAAACVAGLAVCACFVVAISWHTFAVHRHVSTFSESMRNFNAAMTKVLIVQVTMFNII